MVNCRELNRGYTEYRCPDCGEIKYVAFTCKSRLCTSCGKKATDEWVEELLKDMVDVPHRHKMVRYYGIYSRTKKSQAQKIMSVWKKYKRLAYKRIYWRERIIKSFGLDPLLCPKCGKEMEVNDIFYKKYGRLLGTQYF